MMAEAVCRAIKDVTGKETCIKWVNDIFYDGKKIAGILTEGETSIEDGTLAYVVIGVGINLYMPYEGFPEDIKNTAGALLNTGFDAAKRNSLYAAIINRFYELYNAHDADVFVEDYKRRSFLIGKYVKIMQHSARSRRGRDYAEVIGIDDECRLLVKYEDGTTEALMSGEVSVVRY